MAYINKEKLILDVQKNLIPGTDVDGTVFSAEADRYFINLINKQPVADVENLKQHNKEYSFCNLLGNCLVYSKNLKDYNDMRKGLKSEARKELAERLKEKATSAFFDEREYVDTVDIDNLVKEMEK